MLAEDPCSEMIIEVRSFHLWRAVGVELVLAPGGYERIISFGRHRISLQELCLAYRNTRAELSSTCQIVSGMLASFFLLDSLGVIALAS